MFVELGAVPGQVFVLHLRVADAGVQVQNAHGLQPVGQRLIQHPTHAALLGIVVQVDGQLAGPVVGGTAHEGPGVGVALDAAVLLDDEIRILFHGVPHPALKFGEGRHGVLKGDDRVLDIIGVNFQNARRIGEGRIADGDICHKSPFFPHKASLIIARGKAVINLPGG